MLNLGTEKEKLERKIRDEVYGKWATVLEGKIPEEERMRIDKEWYFKCKEYNFYLPYFRADWDKEYKQIGE